MLGSLMNELPFSHIRFNRLQWMDATPAKVNRLDDGIDRSVGGRRRRRSTPKYDGRSTAEWRMLVS
jgi:hypothetical protein